MKPTRGETAAKTWQAVREAWAWLDREEFIDLESLTDQVAVSCGNDFNDVDDQIMRDLARGGIALHIKARAWLGPHVSAKEVMAWMESHACHGDFSSNLQNRYSVERSGREGYVRMEDLTDAEKSIVEKWLRASANEAAIQVK